MMRRMGPASQKPAGTDISGNDSKVPVSVILKRLMSYMGKYKLSLLPVLLLIMMGAVSSSIAALFLRSLVDDYITPLMTQNDPSFNGLARMLVIMFSVQVTGALSVLIYNRIMVSIAQKVLKNIRDDLFAHLQRLPVRFYDTHPHGDVMSHFTNDTEALRNMISQNLSTIFSSVIMLIAVFTSMLSQSVYLTGLVCLFTFGIAWVSKLILGRSGRYFFQQQSAIGDLNGYIEEIITGQKVVKIFNHEQAAAQVFYQKNDTLREISTKATIYGVLMAPINNGIGQLIYVVIAFVGGALAIAGIQNLSLAGFAPLTLGTLVSFLTLSGSFFRPIGQVSMIANSLTMAMAGARRVFLLMDEPIEEDRGYVTMVPARMEKGEVVPKDRVTGMWAWKQPHQDGTVSYTKVEGNVELTDVDFAYVAGKPVLKNVTVHAAPGQKIAFVGATGAGKTTITNLINRFYEIDEGKIQYDGININKIKKSDLRHSLGVVLQDVNLFTGTVMENIRYGRLDATDEECIAAAKLAQADGFIQMLPQGYNTVLTSGGSGLSQGQRQLLSIARAAVADPPVMILDEATSAIDTMTELLVQQAMDNLMQGRTVFVIAHRLSTVRNADVIMVLDHGEIIERGSHQELLDKKGVYYQLYTGAFELS